MDRYLICYIKAYLAGKSPFAISGNANAPMDNTDVRLSRNKRMAYVRIHYNSE